MAWLKIIAAVAFVLLIMGAAGVVFVLPSMLEDSRDRTTAAKISPAPSQNAPPAAIEPPGQTARPVERLPARTERAAEPVSPVAPAPDLPTPDIPTKKPSAAIPSFPETTRAEGPATSEVAALPETTAENPAKSESERLLDQGLRLQARLENDGVRVWGAERLVTSYPDALGALEDANSAFDRKAYVEAAARFRTSIAALRRLDASRPERLQRALKSGQAALQQLDPAAAKRQFETALAIDPGHGQAKQGLSRAKNLRRVAELTEAGTALVARHQLESGRQAFEQAVAIDPEFAPARAGLTRVEGIITERDFRRSVSTALAALDRRDFGQADRALAAVRRLRPEAPEIKDIQLRLSNLRRTVALQDLRRRARRHEAKEDWEQAVAAYDNALKIDATTGFAIRGKENAEKRLRLHRMIDFYLSRPDRLQSARPRIHARKVLETANAIAQPGPVLSRKRDRLRGLISTAETPVAVILRSDGNTQVVINRVGRFGSFAERRLQLLPGSYAAVGSRPGYRDVRVKFRVPAGDGETIVVVRCEEPI